MQIDKKIETFDKSLPGQMNQENSPQSCISQSTKDLATSRNLSELKRAKTNIAVSNVSEAIFSDEDSIDDLLEAIEIELNSPEDIPQDQI